MSRKSSSPTNTRWLQPVVMFVLAASLHVVYLAHFVDGPSTIRFEDERSYYLFCADSFALMEGTLTIPLRR